MLPDKRLCSHLIFDDTQRDTLVCTFGCCAGFCRLGSHPLQESAQRHLCEHTVLEGTALPQCCFRRGRAE